VTTNCDDVPLQRAPATLQRGPVRFCRDNLSFIRRHWRGAKLHDLQQATNKYALVINLKTAKALCLTISPSALARTDEVIE